MSQLLARIMLAMLMLPLAAILYLLVIIVMMEAVLNFRDEEAGFVITGVITTSFVVVYWYLLWKSTVRFHRQRIIMTLGWSGAVFIVGVAVGAVLEDMVGNSFGIFAGNAVVILLWLFATTLIWRETAEERAQRIRAVSAGSLVCPTCGYNMTGLRDSTCPECGAKFTLNELMAMQPAKEGAEITG